LVILVSLLLSLEQVRIVSLHLVLILTINLVVRFGFVHYFVEALRKDEPGEVLLIDFLLLHLGFSDPVEMALLVGQDSLGLGRAATSDTHRGSPSTEDSGGQVIDALDSSSHNR